MLCRISKLDRTKNWGWNTKIRNSNMDRDLDISIVSLDSNIKSYLMRVYLSKSQRYQTAKFDQHINISSNGIHVIFVWLLSVVSYEFFWDQRDRVHNPGAWYNSLACCMPCALRVCCKSHYINHGITIQWNLSITTTSWDTSLHSGAHLGGQGPLFPVSCFVFAN